jgi:hypothetical protein
MGTFKIPMGCLASRGRFAKDHCWLVSCPKTQRPISDISGGIGLAADEPILSEGMAFRRAGEERFVGEGSLVLGQEQFLWEAKDQ